MTVASYLCMGSCKMMEQHVLLTPSITSGSAGRMVRISALCIRSWARTCRLLCMRYLRITMRFFVGVVGRRLRSCIISIAGESVTEVGT